MNTHKNFKHSGLYFPFENLTVQMKKNNNTSDKNSSGNKKKTNNFPEKNKTFLCHGADRYKKFIKNIRLYNFEHCCCCTYISIH